MPGRKRSAGSPGSVDSPPRGSSPAPRGSPTPPSPTLMQLRSAVPAAGARWRAAPYEFRSIAAARSALCDRSWLDGYWDEAQDTLARLLVSDAAPQVCDAAAIVQLQLRTLTVYLFGESGAGKSTLLEAIVGEDFLPEGAITVSSTTAGTLAEVSVETPSGVTLVDTPGFRLPADTAWGLPAVVAPVAWLKSKAAWRRQLRDVERRVLTGRAAEPGKPALGRPHVALYCHKAGTRLLPERLREVLRIPHMKAQVPTFFVLTDVCSVTDAELQEIRGAVDAALAELGPNSIGLRVAVLEVNSSDKTVRGHKFKVTGVAEVVAAVLNAIAPSDVLRLVRKRGWFSPQVADLTGDADPAAPSPRKRPRLRIGYKAED